MEPNILFAAKSERWEDYETPLRAALAEAGVEAHLSTDIPDDRVDYIIYAPNSGLSDFRPFTRAKAVLSL